MATKAADTKKYKVTDLSYIARADGSRFEPGDTIVLLNNEGWLVDQGYVAESEG